MGIYKRIVQLKQHVFRQLQESPHDTNRLRYFIVVTLFTWSLKVKVSSSIKEWLSELSEWLISNCNVFEWVFVFGYYYMCSFTNIETKSVGHEPVITSYQFPIHSGINIVNVTDWKQKLLYRQQIYARMSLIYIKKWLGRHWALQNS